MSPVVEERLEALAVEEESWFKSYWRPAAAWVYLVICFFDYLVAPVLFPVLFFKLGIAYVPWSPLTIQAGGMFHVAFGAIIGITSWSRGQEKMKILDKGKE